MQLARAAAGHQLACLWLLLAPGLASAAIPIGSFGFRSSPSHSIWLDDGAVGEDELCDELAADFDLVEYCHFEASVDGKGRISGFFEFAGQDDSVRIELAGPLKGSQKGDGNTGLARTNLSLKLSGEAHEGAFGFDLKGSIKFSGEIAQGIATGLLELRICIKGIGCESAESFLPAEVLAGGSWGFVLEIGDAGGGALNGVAQVDFEGGWQCFYAIGGRYNAKSDLASLSLTPISPDCAGTSLQLKEFRSHGGGAFTARLRYQLFGYKGDTYVVPLAPSFAFGVSNFLYVPSAGASLSTSNAGMTVEIVH